MKMNNKSSRKTVIVICSVISVLIIIGTALAIIPFVLFNNIADKSMSVIDNSSHDITVKAEIAENLTRQDEDGNTVYTPVYEYEYKGKKYRVTSDISSIRKKYDQGDKVEIMISASFPGNMWDPAYNSATAFRKAQSGMSKVMLMMILVPAAVILIIVITVTVVILKSMKKNEPVYDGGSQEEYTDPNDDYRG